MKRKTDMQREVEKALSYPGYYYLPYNLLEGDILTPEEQRAELKHLLRVARSRQAHLRKNPRFAESRAAREVLPKINELKTDRAISRALSDVAEFIRSRRSTVRGAKEYEEDIIETLSVTFEHDREVDFTDPSFNWDQFGRFMQQMKKAGKANEGEDSQRAVKLYFLAKGVGLSLKGLRDNYDTFKQRQDELVYLYHNNPYGKRSTTGEKMLERLDNIDYNI